MPSAFGNRLRELRSERKILQSAFAETCDISAAYLSDIERGKRNPPADTVILEWASHLDATDAEEIGQELLSLAARDRRQAEVVTEDVTEPAATIWTNAGPSAPVPRNPSAKSDTPFLDHFGVDMLDLARQGRLDRAPGRGSEVLQIAAIVACRQRNSAVITSDLGAEIQQVLHGLAGAMASASVPPPLMGKRLMRVDGLQAGVKYRGQLEERVSVLIRECADQGNVLLVFHSLGDLVDLEKSVIGSLIGVALEAGAPPMVTGAVPTELDHARRLNPRLVDAFRAVAVQPLDRDGVLRALTEAEPRYAEHHGVTYDDASLVAIVDAAESGDAAGLWQRSLDLLDEVGAQARLAEADAVTVAEVDAATGR